MFNEMLEWIDELHPLEREGLTLRAYGIVANEQWRWLTFDDEIALPATYE